MSFSVFQYADAGCELADPIHMFVAVHMATNENPCNTGCAYYKGGQCKAYLALNRKEPTVKAPVVPEYGETVKQEAARLGVSISEVRRRRREAIK